MRGSAFRFAARQVPGGLRFIGVRPHTSSMELINEDNKTDVGKFALDRRPRGAITVEDDCGISKAKNDGSMPQTIRRINARIGDSGGSWAAPMRISWEALQSDGPTIISSRRVNYV
jgi:hypothetical protein